MPGKKDPEYFPLNLNMSGLGIGPYYVNGSHHGKFDGASNGGTLSEFVNLNGMPPVNSDEEDDDLDQDGSESVSSVQGSDLDVDVDVDVVDTLVMSIRDKLRMGSGNGMPGGRYPSDFWTDVVPNSSPNTNTNANSDSHSDSMMMLMNEDLHGHFPHHHLTLTSGSDSASNNSSSSSSIADGSTGGSSGGRRRRVHPYSHSNSHSHSHWRRHSTNNYHLRSHHHVHHGSIQKTKSSCQNHWWTSKSYNDISKRSGKNSSADTSDDPYQLLQELIQSGDLIKEAVRRLNKKCFTSSNSNNIVSPNSSSNNTNTINSHNPSSNNLITNSISSSSSNNSGLNNANNKKFTYRDEDAENSYPLHSVLPVSAP